MTCSSCSGEAPDGSRFCPWCALELATPPSADAPTEVSSESAREASTEAATELPTRTGVVDPAQAGSRPSSPRRGFTPGTIIDDRYRLDKVVGSGGMGEVWLAEQLKPVRRQVAFKVIKRGMDTGQVVQRFEAERQALALMDHPAVAKVFDAGSTPGGRPYFVMEYVTGAPMARFCDEQKMTTDDRLKLFELVCDGVQHAHHKAIIHRDLKPSNVLVSLQDGTPVPKIIDFGIAKATGQQLTDQTMQTQLGMLIGTPEYMSPEQARGQEVDTRSDVYSLGVMLYELLVGTRPFETRELLEGGYDSLFYKICEEAPKRPSTRLRTLGDECKNSAANRRTDPGTLRRQLSGDLDWITMKALEKEPARRYSSPAAFANDIQCYREHKPVIARPPTFRYRVGKFVRRHRWGVAAAALLTLALVGGTIGTAVGLVRAKHETRKAQAVTAHMIDILSEANPEKAKGKTITVQEALDASNERVAGSFKNEPELEMEVRATIALVYHELGAYDEAEEHLRRAAELADRTVGPRDEFAVGVRARLARTLMDSGRLDDAEREMQALLPVFRKKYGDQHRETLALMHNLAAVYLHQKRYDRAEPLLVEVAQGRREVLGAEDTNTQSSVGNLAQLYIFTERYEEAEPLMRESLILRRRTLGETHPRTLISVFNLGDLYLQTEEFARAEGLIREALEGFRKVVGENHPYSLAAMEGLVKTLIGLERLEEAEGVALESYRLRRERFGADHGATAEAAALLVQIYDRAGQPEKAAPYRL